MVRAAHRKGASAHRGEARGIGEEAVDFEGDRRKFVAADGGAFFEKVIGVAFLLAGDG